MNQPYIPLNDCLLPKPLAQDIGNCLKQGRTASGLSIAQAANEIGISPFQLRDFENGDGGLTREHSESIIGTYGGACADRLDSILYTWGRNLVERLNKARRRWRLSVVGSDLRDHGQNHHEERNE